MPDNQIKLLNVRLSFPDLWKAKAVTEGAEPKFGAHFLLDKKEAADQIKQIKAEIWALAKEKWQDKAKEMIQKGKIHVCLHEGNEKEYDGYTDDNMFISANSPNRPLIIDWDKGPLSKEDGRPYAGCYVNAIIRLWVQDNQFGKRVNAELLGVQFAKKGEAFGGGRVDEADFEELPNPDGGNGGKKKKAAK